MKKPNFKKIFLTAVFTGLGLSALQAQEGKDHLTQEEKINQLLELKAEMTISDKLDDRYKIQLFYGDNGEANEVIKEYRKEYNYPSRIAYEEPNYKVWVGNFRNRLEADRALLEIKKKFPSAFIPKPSRS